MACSIIMLLNHHTYHCQRRSHVRKNFTGAAAAAKAQEALDDFKEEALEELVLLVLLARVCCVMDFPNGFSLVMMITETSQDRFPSEPGQTPHETE